MKPNFQIILTATTASFPTFTVLAQENRTRPRRTCQAVLDRLARTCTEGPEAYRHFGARDNGWIKVILPPDGVAKSAKRAAPLKNPVTNKALLELKGNL